MSTSVTPRTPDSGVSQVNVDLHAKLGSSRSRLSPEREVAELAVAKSIHEIQLDSQVPVVGRRWTSLGTRPSKNRKGGSGKWAGGGSVHFGMLGILLIAEPSVAS